LLTTDRHAPGGPLWRHARSASIRVGVLTIGTGLGNACFVNRDGERE
jgi:hypothetical protein